MPRKPSRGKAPRIIRHGPDRGPKQHPGPSRRYSDPPEPKTKRTAPIDIPPSWLSPKPKRRRSVPEEFETDEKPWEKRKCPRGFVLRDRRGRSFLWITDPEDPREIWFELVMPFLTWATDRDTGEIFTPPWIRRLRQVRSSRFHAHADFLLEVYPSRGGVPIGSPEYSTYDMDVDVVRPRWRWIMEHEIKNHFYVVFEWLLDLMRTRFGATPPIFILYVTRFSVVQTVETCVPKRKPKVPPKPVKPPKRPVKPRYRRETYVRKTDRKKYVQTIYRDAKGRFTSAPKPLRKRKPRKGRRK